MTQIKHSKEESLYLNNHHDNSISSSDDLSEDENDALMVKSHQKNNKQFFIYNDLKGARKGGPTDNNDKNCKCCGKRFRSKYYYLPLNFECGNTVEDHPVMSLECATGNVCCIHHWTSKIDDMDEEDLRDE